MRSALPILPAGPKERPQRSASAQPIEAAQNCFDQAAEFATKFCWNV